MFAFNQVLPALRMLLVLSVLTGVAYPLLVTGIAQLAFPGPANGSLVVVDGKTMGSSLIGQPFDEPKYFWSRPSATAPQPYNGMGSTGSNQGARNPALADAVTARVKALRDADPGNTAPVPVDLVTASASVEVTCQSLAAGLDCDYMTGEQPYKMRLATASAPLYRLQATPQQLAALGARSSALIAS